MSSNEFYEKRTSAYIKKETQKQLRMISALTGETLVEVLGRLVDIEHDRVLKEHKVTIGK